MKVKADRLEMGQNKVARMAMNAPRYAVIEALRGDMEWSTLREKQMKAILKFKVRLEQMEDIRMARRVYLWSSKWVKKCGEMVQAAEVIGYPGAIIPRP